MLPMVSANKVVRDWVSAVPRAGIARSSGATAVIMMFACENAALQYVGPAALIAGPNLPIRSEPRDSCRRDLRCTQSFDCAPFGGIQVLSIAYLSEQQFNSNRHLGSNLDHPAGRDLEKVGGIAGRLRQADEQMILPGRHPGMRRGL